MRHPQMFALGAAGAIVLWIVLTFVMDLRSGWTHVPLVVGVILAVAGIVEGVDALLSSDRDSS